MRAAAWNTANTLDLAERPAPELATGEVLIRTGTVAIRGSGLHFYRGEFRGLPGMVPGHEISGVVEAGGALEPGTAVAVQPTVACRSCAGARAHGASGCGGARAANRGIPQCRTRAEGDHRSEFNPRPGRMVAAQHGCVAGVRFNHCAGGSEPGFVDRVRRTWSAVDVPEPLQAGDAVGESAKQPRTVAGCASAPVLRFNPCYHEAGCFR